MAWAILTMRHLYRDQNTVRERRINGVAELITSWVEARQEAKDRDDGVRP
jgi:hypothetical protein